MVEMTRIMRLYVRLRLHRPRSGQLYDHPAAIEFRNDVTLGPPDRINGLKWLAELKAALIESGILDDKFGRALCA
jgi:hypothetical protein